MRRVLCFPAIVVCHVHLQCGGPHVHGRLRGVWHTSFFRFSNSSFVMACDTSANLRCDRDARSEACSPFSTFKLHMKFSSFNSLISACCRPTWSLSCCSSASAGNFEEVDWAAGPTEAAGGEDSDDAPASADDGAETEDAAGAGAGAVEESRGAD